MEFYHRQLLKVAVIITGDGELRHFTLHKALLQLLGYDWWDRPGWTVFKLLTRIVYPSAYVFLLVIVSILAVNGCYSIDTDTTIGFFIFMNNIICTFTFSYAAIKTIYLKLFYGKEVKSLFEYLESIGELKEKSVWLTSLKSFTYYWALLGLMCVVWAFYFLIFWDVTAIHASYPWYQESGAGKLIALFCSFMTAFFCSVIHAAVDSTICVSCGIIISHLIILKDMLQTLGKDRASDKVLLRKCIRLHVKLIRASEKMNYCFHLLFAFQPVYTVLHACIIIFTFVKARDLIGAICNTMPMLIASYAQLFLYCYYGQMLSSSFEDLTFATYNNYWYRCDLSVKKSLINILRISKKPIALRGLGTSKASYASYLETFQESISYYLILKTVTGSNTD